MKYRFATPEDAALLAEWAVNNPDIPMEDIRAVAASPSSVALIVADDDGKILLFLPWYVSLTIGYCGFNPEATPKERIKAINEALPIVEAAAKKFGIAHIEAFSKAEYLMAQWTVKHGFVEEDRQAFVKTLPKDK